MYLKYLSGLTHSSCTVLNSNGVESPFNGPENNQICFNGKFQHSYFLRSVVDTVKAISQAKYALPLFSYMSLSVGHDNAGRRIQTLDDDLVQYVTELAHDNSTLTIILADHGNTYTYYASAILEGKFEMFHPHLFMIVPTTVADYLGEKALEALRINQRRIVSMYDLHDTIMALAASAVDEVRPAGLFQPIKSNRTCDDIKLLTPNLCVCDGWDSPTSNDTLKMALVEFAVGQLNNLLQDKLLNNHSSTPSLSSCERIRPIRYENIRVRNSKTDGSLITTFDLVVHAGNVVPQKEDVFHLEVKSFELPEQISFDMQLLSYDRLTMFGKYKQCAAANAPLKLCICSKDEKGNSTTENKKDKWLENSIFFGKNTKFKRIKSSKCLFLTKRDFDSTVIAYEVTNSCKDKRFVVSIDINNDQNVRISRAVPFKADVFPLSVRFAMTVRRMLDLYEQTHNVIVTVDKQIQLDP